MDFDEVVGHILPTLCSDIVLGILYKTKINSQEILLFVVFIRLENTITSY